MTAMRVEGQLVYILHKRAYRDSSEMLEIFSHDYGRLCLVARASRGAKSRTAAILQLFRPLLMSWQGRTEMPTLTNVENAAMRPPALTGKALLSAMYLNELLMHLLHRNDVHETVFGHYHDTLFNLATEVHIELVLRRFEKQLLQALGFALNLGTDADSGAAVSTTHQYRFHHEHGPVRSHDRQTQADLPLVSGASLLAFDNDQLLPEHASEIKYLMRFVLSRHLGHKRLRSRELFRPPQIK